MIRRLLIALPLFVFVCASPARADNTTAANARELFFGQAQIQVFNSGQFRWYKANLVAGRSYSVLAWAPYTDPSQATVSLDMFIYLDNGITAAGTVTTGDVEPRLELSNNGDQTRIIPTTSGTHRILVENFAGGGYSVHVMIVETTLFSPWYFAAAPYDGFITIRNNMNTSVTATVTAFNPDGSVVGSQTIVIPGNGNTFVTATSLGATQSGSAQIAHNGSQNGISANITTLSATTGLSFDAPFTPRMQWGMTPAF
jgi:hypothetical protein